MNNDRRKALRKLADEIRGLSEALGTIISKAEDIHGELETLKDDEQEYYDNMPESLQNGEKGETASEAIGNLETALDVIAAVKDLESLDQAVDAIESAC